MKKQLKKIDLQQVDALDKQQLRTITGGLGLHLDSWIDQNGSAQGDATIYLF